MIDFRQKPHPHLPQPVATSPAITEINDVDEHWWSSDDESQTQRDAINTRASKTPYQSERSKGDAVKTFRRYSVQKPIRDKSKRRLYHQNARAGIRVITDFAASRNRAAKAGPGREDENPKANHRRKGSGSRARFQSKPMRQKQQGYQSSRVGLTEPESEEEDANDPQTSMSLFFHLAETPDEEGNGIQAYNIPQMPSIDPDWKQGDGLRKPALPENGNVGGHFVNLNDLASTEHHSSNANPGRGPPNRHLQKHEAGEAQSVKGSRRGVNQPRYMGLGDFTSPSPKRSRTDRGNGSRPVRERGLGLTPLKIQEKLSPSDRKILIGLDIPETVSSNTPSRLGNQLGDGAQSSERSAPPITPAILITPARENPLWQEAMESNNLRSRPRARSSVYSQNTTGNMDGSTLYSHNSSNPFNSRHDMGSLPSRSIRDSEITVFEEDVSPSSTTGRDIQSARSSRFRPSPIDTRHTRGLSVDTITNRPQSNGWWNVITSPWLTRSSTNASRKGFSPDEDQPKLPSLAHAAEMIRKHHERKQSEKNLNGGPLLSEEKESSEENDTMTTTNTGDFHDFGTRKDHGAIDTKELGVAAAAIGMVPVALSTESPQDYVDEKNDPSNPYYQPKQNGIHAWLPAPAPASPPRFAQSPEEKSPDSLFGPADREVPMVFDDGFGQTRGEDDLDPALRSQMAPGSMFPVGAERKTPTVHRADAVRVIPGPGWMSEASRSFENGQAKYTSPVPPPYSKKPAPIAVTAYSSSHEYPQSPGPRSPGLRRVMMAARSEPMSEVPLTPAQEPYATDFEHPSKQWPPMPVRPERKKGRPFAGGLKTMDSKKRRRCFVGLTCGGIGLIILIIALAMTVHKKSKAAIVQSQWLNITGFPPIPTGVSTIVQPDNPVQDTSCVAPSTLWSCAVPKEIQQSILPSQPDQPSFALQILYQNNTNTTLNTRRSVVSNPVSVRRLLSNAGLTKRDSSSNWTPIPEPPSLEEQKFIGQTTDNITSDPKEGEQTPFYISFQTTASTPSKMRKRQESGSDPFPDPTANIPPPALNPDGTVKAANLLPLPVMQPLRLYDRGLPTEHYGCYNYFDRSIFSTSEVLLNQTNQTTGSIPDDENGGATDSNGPMHLGTDTISSTDLDSSESFRWESHRTTGFDSFDKGIFWLLRGLSSHYPARLVSLPHHDHHGQARWRRC
jgi:hypothetical protein